MEEQKSSHFYIITIAFFATIAGLLFGFDTGVISGALQFISQAFGITKQHYQLQECIVAAVPFGALIGAVLSKKSSFLLGRRRSIITTAVMFVIGTLMVVLAIDVWMVVVGRLIMGMAVGLSAMIVPMYLSELSPPDIRGAIVFCFQLAITVGLFLAFLINALFIDGNWRAMFAVGLIPSILLWVGMLFLPSSPRWLILKGRVEEAKCVLEKLRQHNIDQELAEIQETAKHARGNWRLLFSKHIRVLVMITFGLFMFQQLSGINTIMYYAPIIYKQAGFQSAHGQFMAAVADGLVFVLATIVGIWTVDRLGRRPLFFIGFVGMIICLAVVGSSYLHLFGQAGQVISVVAVLGYIVFFGISLGPLSYLMMSELFPLNVKGAGMAIASCANWGFNVLVSATFLTLVHWLTIGYTFYVYAFLTLLGLFFVYHFVPETKNRALEEIEANLYQGARARDLGKPIPGLRYQ